MYHSTDPKNAAAIQQSGLEVGRESVHTTGGEWADKHYGTRPVYVSVQKGKYEGKPLAVDTSGLDMVADLPSLVDTGAYIEEEGMWWDEGSEPEDVLNFIDENGMIYYEDLVSPGHPVAQAAISATGTAAVLENIPPERIQIMEENKMKITKRQLRRIIKESKGWFLLGLDGTLAKSQKTRTPIWWSDEAGAQRAYDNGYGGEGAVPVEILLAPDIYAYNGSDADPADLESVRQHWAPGTLNKVPSELGESKMKITKRQLRRIIKESVLKENRREDLRRLKQEDPMEYLQAKFGEGAALTTKEMEREGLYDAYEDWIMNALDDGDPNVKLISRDLAIYLPDWNKQ